MVDRGWRLYFYLGVAALLLFNGCGKRPDRTVLQEGLRMLDGGHYAQSILLFQRAIGEDVNQEDKARANNGLGIAFWRTQQKDQAIQAFETAARLAPDLLEPRYNLGALKYESGQETEAIVCFEKAALIDSRETRPLEFLAVIYQKRQQWDQAQRVLAAAQARAPRSSRVLTFRALLELQTNNVAAAVALLQQALEHDAHYAPAVFNLAVMNRRHTNNPDQAQTYFKDYLGLVPTGPLADKARQALKELSEAKPAPVAVSAPPAVTPPTAEELMETAKKLERAGRREAAINNYLKAVHEAERAGNGPLKERALRDAGAQCADDARANYELGQYYAEHKQNDQAVTYLKKAVGLSTNWFDAQFALAKTAQEIEEFDTARLLVKQADRSRPEQPDALWALAQFCDRNASLQDLAAPFYSRFAKQYPEDARAGASRERAKALQGGAPRPAGDSETVPSASSSSWWSWLTR